MVVSPEDVLYWHSDSLYDAAAVLRKAAASYATVGDQLESLFLGDFQGAAADAEARSRRVLVDDARDLARLYESAARDMEDAAIEVDALVSRAWQLVGVPLISCEPTTHYLACERNGGVSQVLADARAIQEVVRGVYAMLGGAKGIAAQPAPSVMGARSPHETWSVEEVNDWWVSLSAQEQETIIVDHPEWVGNRAGIPFLVRDRANRYLLDKLIAEQQAIVDGPYHDTTSELALDKLRELKMLRRLFPKTDKAGIATSAYHLVSVDADSGWRLHAAVGIGDIDRADHVLVHTVGMSNQVEGTLVTEQGKRGSAIADVDAVLDQASSMLRQQERSDSVAAIVMVDYDSPQLTESLTWGHSVLESSAAKAGVPGVVAMLEGVQATHAGEPHVVPSGHSYGSYLTGMAVSESLVPDDFAFFGSAGVSTMENADLHLLPHRVMMGEADHDLVADTGWYGGDPSWSGSFDRWSTEEWISPEGERYTGSSGHSEYMVPGSTSVRNLASILIGDGISVEFREG